MRFREFAGALFLTVFLGCTDSGSEGDGTDPSPAARRLRLAPPTVRPPWNAAQLTLAWSFSTGVNRGQEAAPLVVDGTKYVVTPYPNIRYALDLTRPGAPTKWTYRPEPLAAAQGVACCDVVNRGPAYADGRIFYSTLDAHTIAVDAQTGREIWRTKLGGESCSLG